MNRYTDITPALYSEREAEESSLMGRAGVWGSGNAPAGSSWNTVIEPLQWDGIMCMGQEWALGTS